MKTKDFIINYCKENNLIFADPTGFMNDCCCNIEIDERMFTVKVCKKYTYFKCKNTNINYKAVIENNYLILI